MPDFAPWITAILAGMAVLLAVRASLGATDHRVQHCRACGRDARPFAWRIPCRCDCGADLSRAEAVRCPRRRSRRAIALACVMIAAGALFGTWSTEVRARGVGWRDELPLWAYASVVRRGWDDRVHASARRRLCEIAPDHDVVVLRDALATQLKEDGSWSEASELFLCASLIVPPDGHVGARVVAAKLKDVTLEAEPFGKGVLLQLGDYFHRANDLMLRIDQVLLDGQPKPFSMRTERATAAIGKGSFNGSRVWFPIREPLQFVVDDHELAFPHDVRVVIEAAAIPPNFEAAAGDRVIAETRNPGSWGVRVATGSFELRSRGAISDGERSGSRMTRLLPPIAAIPRIEAAAPHVAMGATGALIALMLALGARVAVRLACGSFVLAPPACTRCGSFLAEPVSFSSRCTECGAEQRGTDARVVSRSQRRRWLALLAVWVVTGITALLGGPALCRFIAREYTERCTTPAQRAASLIVAPLDRAWLDMSPGAPPWAWQMPRLWMLNPHDDPNLNSARIHSLLAWWHHSNGVLPSMTGDATGERRRMGIASALQEAVAMQLVEEDDVRAVLTWCGALEDPLVLPLFVRAGEPVRTGCRPGNERMVVVRRRDESVRERSWEHTVATPSTPGMIDAEVLWWWPPDDPSLRAMGSKRKPAIEHALRARVLVLPPGDERLATESALDSCADAVQFGCRIRSCGARSAVQLVPPEHRHRNEWIGRWEVLASERLDATPLVVFQSQPRGEMQSALATIPHDLPSALFVRFVPDVAQVAGAPDFSAPVRWGRTTTFRLLRAADESAEGARTAVYKTEACALLAR